MDDVFDAKNRGNIGFIGTGQMALALAEGFVRAKKIASENLFGYDVSATARDRFARQTGATECESISALLDSAATIFLCVKPQQMADLLGAIKNSLSGSVASDEAGLKSVEEISSKLFVTIAAGIPISTYEQRLADTGGKIRLIRAMPNTPCLVGAGATGFAASAHLSPEERRFAQELLETVGLAVEVPERLLDAVTGLSGSGPAYLFQMIEALSDGGVKMGLPRDIATKLAAQTLKGAAEMVLLTGEHPGVLKGRVTSPGGTTIAGLAAMESHGVRSGLIAAVEAATERSIQLGRNES